MSKLQRMEPPQVVRELIAPPVDQPISQSAPANDAQRTEESAERRERSGAAAARDLRAVLSGAPVKPAAPQLKKAVDELEDMYLRGATCP